MKFEGKIDVKAPVTETWDFLMDIGQFSQCLPGLEEVRQVDETTFDGMIQATVGPISGQFNFRAKIVESDPPKKMVVRCEGKDSVTHSTVISGMALTLRESSPGNTELNYRADVEIQGRLAILGDMILRATTSLILDEFSRRLRQRLEGPA